MRKLVLILLIAGLGFLGCEKAAEAWWKPAAPEADHTVVGLKVDAPNLIQLDKKGDWSLGAEGGKEVLKDIFRGDTRDWVEADKGYFAYIKITYSGCLLNCKEE